MPFAQGQFSVTRGFVPGAITYVPIRFAALALLASTQSCRVMFPVVVQMIEFNTACPFLIRIAPVML
jgi:hypothetical protein